MQCVLRRVRWCCSTRFRFRSTRHCGPLLRAWSLPFEEEVMSDEAPARSRTTRFSIVAVLVELAGGVVVGLLLARLGGYVGALVGRGGEAEFADLVGAVIGTFLGYIVGVAAGLSLAGRLVGQRGSFWLALAGSILGGVLVALLAEPLRLNRSTQVLAFAVFFVALALALVGFNLRRSRRRSKIEDRG